MILPSPSFVCKQWRKVILILKAHVFERMTQVAITGYEIMCAQICEWLEQRGHTLFVLTSVPLEVHATQEHVVQGGSIPVRRTLRCYWDGAV